MKTRFRLILGLLLVLAIIIIGVYVVSKGNFYRKMNKVSLNSEHLWFGYPTIFNGFFDTYFRYPNQLNELYDFYSNNAVAYEEIVNRMKDPFSETGADLLYVPVYSKLNNLCEGYLLISAGIDGKLNNLINDTTYFEDVKKLTLYNQFDAATSLSFRQYNLTFKLTDYLFGDKDLLVEFANGIDIFINNSSHRIFTPSALMDKSYPKGFSRLDCCVEGIVKSIDSNKVVVVDSKSSAVCSMYSGRLMNVEESDEVKIIGQYKNRIDSMSRTIFLENCIVINR
ncbi:hypothetical protein DSECCO2_227930 [anaerobic digester metagenome]